jgi:hypothetical protein
VVDVELDEHLVVEPEGLDGVEPGVDVPGLGFGLERGRRLVPRLDAASREVIDAVLVRERADVVGSPLVEDPAVVGIIDVPERDELALDHIERLTRGDAERDHRHAHVRGRLDLDGTLHLAHEAPEHRRQQSRLVEESDRLRP